MLVLLEIIVMHAYKRANKKRELTTTNNKDSKLIRKL